MGNVNAKFNNILLKLPYGKECGGVYKVFIIVLLLIVLYNIFLVTIAGSNHYHRYDVINRIATTLPVVGKISYWPITHFVLFFILGLLFPKCDVLVITAGILWEVLEEIYGRLVTTNTSKDPGVQYTRWWSGSLIDILFNIIGFYLGKMLAITFNLRINIPWINDTCRWC